MRSRRVVVALVAGMLGVSVGAVAAPPKGAVSLSWRTLDDVRGDLSSLRGRVLVVVFFKPGEGESGKALEAMRRAQPSAEPRGVAFIGVSQGTDANALRSFLDEHRVDFPVHFDEKKGGEPVFKQWRVTKTPTVFIIDPDRNVVEENPALDGLGETLAKQIERTPPRLFDQKKVEEAVRHIEFGEAMLRMDPPRARAAVRSLALVPEDLQRSEGVSERWVAASRKLEGSGKALLEQSEQLYEEKKVAAAVVLLEQMKLALKGSVLEAKVDEQLNSFLDDPDLKAEVEKAKKAATAADLLEAVGDHEAAKDMPGANAIAQEILKDYAGTPSAAEAKQRIARWESDPKLKRQLRDAVLGARADSLLKAAEAYHSSGMGPKATALYEQIVKDYAGTTAAEKAAAALKALGK